MHGEVESEQCLTSPGRGIKHRPRCGRDHFAEQQILGLAFFHEPVGFAIPPAQPRWDIGEGDTVVRATVSPLWLVRVPNVRYHAGELLGRVWRLAALVPIEVE